VFNPLFFFYNSTVVVSTKEKKYSAGKRENDE
jgi:hypothetical protein